VGIRADIASVFELRPSPRRWPVALQGAAAIGLPTIGLALAGEARLGLLASTGAFLALYLTGHSRRARARLLPLVALGFLASAGLGVAASGSVVASLIVLFVVAAGSAVLCLGFGVGPPGGLFFVLVAGVAGHLAAPRELAGGALDGWLVLGMLLLGLVLAYLIVLVPLVRGATRAADAVIESVPLRFSLDEVTRIILTRLVVGCALAVMVAAPLGIHRAYWVVVAVVAILQNGHRLRLTAVRGVHRVLGTVVGVGLFALLQFAQPTGAWLGLSLAALQYAVELVVIRNYGLALVFITPLALLISAQAGDALGVVVDRVADTLLGAAIAMVVLLVALLVQRRGLRRPTPGAA
jgi:hypothetical protein